MFLASNGVRVDGDPVTFACWLICAAGNISNDDLDLVAEKIGLDLAADLDANGREAVVTQFEAWLRANATYHDPSDLMARGGWPA